MSTELRELMHVKEIFPDIIPVSYGTARQWIMRGKLKVIKIGGRNFMTDKEIKRIIMYGL